MLSLCDDACSKIFELEDFDSRLSTSQLQLVLCNISPRAKIKLYIFQSIIIKSFCNGGVTILEKMGRFVSALFHSIYNHVCLALVHAQPVDTVIWHTMGDSRMSYQRGSKTLLFSCDKYRLPVAFINGLSYSVVECIDLQPTIHILCNPIITDLTKSIDHIFLCQIVFLQPFLHQLFIPVQHFWHTQGRTGRRRIRLLIQKYR
mmetsp:Transcript_34592/g.70761  ORF Transcript_34592/g.70761 Transcript_34592/m.70761 type:complete len:203 (+) Transcript_34592:22-630(+)